MKSTAAHKVIIHSPVMKYMSKWPEALPRESNRKLKKIESISNWYEIYTINENTFALLEPFHIEEVISYLLIGENKALLFDTGMGVSSIKKEVVNITRKELIVLNSHSHYDHVGGNHEFSNVWSFDNDWEVKRLEEGDYSQNRYKDFSESNICTNLPVDFNGKNYHIKPSKIARKIKHLERIDLGKREIIVHHTPGHSPGSICLQDLQYQILFTGDTLYPGEIYLDLEGSNSEAYFKSIEYLFALNEDVKHLCPGHNEALISKVFLRAFKDACEKVKTSMQGDFKSKNLKFENFSISFS